MLLYLDPRVVERYQQELDRHTVERPHALLGWLGLRVRRTYLEVHDGSVELDVACYFAVPIHFYIAHSWGWPGQPRRWSKWRQYRLDRRVHQLQHKGKNLLPEPLPIELLTQLAEIHFSNQWVATADDRTLLPTLLPL